MRDKGDSTLQVFSVPVAVHSAIEDSGLETDNGLLESQIQLTNKVARMATPKETHTSGCNSLPLWKHLATHNEATRKTTLTWKKRGGGKAMYTTKQAPLSSEHQRNNETDATRALWTANSVSSPDISVILQSFVVCLVVLNEGKHRPGDVLYFIRQLSAAAVNLSSKDILQGRIILSNDTDLNQERHFRVVLRAPCEPTEHCETLQTRMEEFVTSGSLNANQADSDFNGVTVRLQSLEYVNKELRLPLVKASIRGYGKATAARLADSVAFLRRRCGCMRICIRWNCNQNARAKCTGCIASINRKIQNGLDEDAIVQCSAFSGAA